MRRFKRNDQAKIKKLQNYYLGEQDITKRKFNDTYKPNNKIVNNFASQIVDTDTGYFLGKPVIYHTADSKDLISEIQHIFDRNHEQKHNTILSSTSSIAGVSYELLYINENNNLKFSALDPANTFMIYDNTTEQRVLAGVRLIDTLDYLTNKTTTQTIVYTSNEIITYKLNSNYQATEIDRQEHYFGSVPIVAYWNNQYMQSSFEKVMSLMDAYNKTVSDAQNDIETFANSYMVFKGLNADEKDLANMKQNMAIQFEDEKGDVSFLTKDVPNEPVKEQREQLKESIALFSGVPDMMSESFGANISAVAIQMKMQPLEQKIAVKQNYFTEALDRRLKLITNYLNISRIDSTKYDYTTISYKFKRNLPYNLHEYGQFAINANGILSHETIVSTMPFIDDVQEELDKLKNQYNDSMTNYQQYDINETAQSVSNTRYLTYSEQEHE